MSNDFSLLNFLFISKKKRRFPPFILLANRKLLTLLKLGSARNYITALYFRPRRAHYFSRSCHARNQITSAQKFQFADYRHHTVNIQHEL